MKFKRILAAIAALALFLSGCGEAAEVKEAQAAAVVPFTCVANPDGSRKMYVILKSYHGTYWEKVIEGVCAAAKETDKAVYLGGIDNETDIAAQKELMEEALAQGADGILLAPVDSTDLVENCARAREKNVPVALVDSAINTGDFDVCFMTDNMEAGKIAAEEMLRLLGEKYTQSDVLQVAIQLSSDTSQGMVNRVSGFLEYWAENAPENWTILEDILLNGGNKDVARKNTQRLLDENPNLRGLFGCNNTSTIGMARTILEENRSDLVMVGFDLAEETRQVIESPDYTAESILQHQDQMGYQGLLTLDALIQKENPAQKYFDTGITVISSANVAELGE